MATATLTPLVHYILAVGPAEPDAALLARFARGGDESAFAELVRRHGPAVLGVCRRVLRDGHAAEDAFQATFLLLARKAGSLHQPERLANWLYGVAYRTAMKLRSSLARRQTREHPFDETAFVPADDPDADLGPELDAAIQQLPSKYRVPFVLCYLQGLTNAEAAARLGCPTNTVATRLSRARERLRCRLTKQGLTAAVSAGLVAATARSAAGTATASPEVLTLMEGVRTAMMWNKMKLAAAAVVVVALTGVGAGRLAFRADAQPPNGLGQPTPAQQLIPPAVADRSQIAPSDRIPPLDLTAPATASKNFDVTGTTPENCRRIATAAEGLRGKLAKLWLGKELPDWPKPCPVKVIVATTAASGATTFVFDDGATAPVQMALTGTLERILYSQLPHEIAHTVLAAHFGRPVPRWADEGVAVLSEDETERNRHANLMTELLNGGRALRLAYLLPLKEYPSDIMTLYAQGYSVTRFLVEKGDRGGFLEFVKAGMTHGWTQAARSTYNVAELADLEKEWIDSLRKDQRAKDVAAREQDNRLTSTYNPPVVTSPPPPMVTEPPPPDVAPTPLPRGYQQQPPTEYVERTYETNRVASGLTVVQAAIEKDGMVVCKFPKTTYYEPVTTYMRDKAGNTRAATSYVRKSIQEERSYRIDQLHITGTNGKPVPEDAVVKRLEKETAVIFLQNGAVDPQLLPLLKDGTLIIMIDLPAPAAQRVGPLPPTTPR
jgi:RNA polymerase sigma factor (sigma-70 family)